MVTNFALESLHGTKIEFYSLNHKVTRLRTTGTQCLPHKVVCPYLARISMQQGIGWVLCGCFNDFYEA